MGESFALQTVFNTETPGPALIFLIFWLSAWTFGGFFIITMLLWTLAGVEVIRVENGILEVGRQIFGLKRSKKYHINEIRHLSIIPFDQGASGLAAQRNFYGLKGGIIKFDYGMKTLSFGGGIDEAEARLMIETFKLNQNFKEINFG